MGRWQTAAHRQGACLGMALALLLALASTADACVSCASGAFADASRVLAQLPDIDLPKPRKPKKPKIPKVLPDADDIKKEIKQAGEALTLSDADCGDHEQPKCPISVQLKPCDDGLVADEGKCWICGPLDERACPITVRVPSCDAGLMESKGRCRDCGGEGERACPITVQVPSCDDGLMERKFRCEACGGHGERECPITVQVQSCDDGLGEYDDFCWRGGAASDPLLHGGPGIVSLSGSGEHIEIWDRAPDGEVYRRERKKGLFSGYSWERWKGFGSNVAWHPAVAHTGEITVALASRGGEGSPITWRHNREVIWNNGGSATYAAPDICTTGTSEFHMISLNEDGRYEGQTVARNLSDLSPDWSVLDFPDNDAWTSSPAYDCLDLGGWRLEIVAGLKKTSRGQGLFVRVMNTVDLPENPNGADAPLAPGRNEPGAEVPFTVREEAIAPPAGVAYASAPALAVSGWYVAIAVLGSDDRIWYTKRRFEYAPDGSVTARWTSRWEAWESLQDDRTFAWRPGLAFADKEVLHVVGKDDAGVTWWAWTDDGGAEWKDWKRVGNAED